jgi:hypothetical protein
MFEAMKKAWIVFAPRSKISSCVKPSFMTLLEQSTDEHESGFDGCAS